LSENSQNRDLQRYKLLKGAYSRVARRLDVDRSFVSRVAHGERRSARVEQALAAEMRRIEKRLAAKDQSASEPAVELATPASREIVKNSVLVVDDEPNVANTVAQILREHGFESRVAYGGQEAIREVAAQAPDIIISDVVMPHINGIEAAKAIHEMSPDTRIVLFSGQAMTNDLLQTARSQGYSFELLSKPVEINTLLDTLRGTGESPFSVTPYAHA